MIVEQVVLCIDRSASTCLACGDGTDTNAKSHKKVMQYGNRNGEPGCGQIFTHVTTMYVEGKELVMSMRPDLEWMESREAIEYRNARSAERKQGDLFGA